jgi:predicted ArsR family transcriptional regulator
MRFLTNIHDDRLDRATSIADVAAPTPPTHEQRQQILKHLPPDLRDVFQLTSIDRLTCRAAADRLGVSPGTVVRQLQRLRGRLRHPVVRALARHGQTLDPATRDLGTRFFLAGQSLTHLSRQLTLTRHELRTHLDQLRGWASSLLHHQPS